MELTDQDQVQDFQDQALVSQDQEPDTDHHQEPDQDTEHQVQEQELDMEPPSLDQEPEPPPPQPLEPLDQALEFQAPALTDQAQEPELPQPPLQEPPESQAQVPLEPLDLDQFQAHHTDKEPQDMELQLEPPLEPHTELQAASPALNNQVPHMVNQDQAAFHHHQALALDTAHPTKEPLEHQDQDLAHQEPDSAHQEQDQLQEAHQTIHSKPKDTENII